MLYDYSNKALAEAGCSLGCFDSIHSHFDGSKKCVNRESHRAPTAACRNRKMKTMALWSRRSGFLFCPC